MTTNDIKRAEILFCCKNREKIFGVTNNKVE